MSRFTSGWVKDHRKQLDSDLIQNVWLWAIWNWLKLAAHYEESEIIWEGECRKLPPGTAVFGFRELASLWKCSPNTIKKWMKYLNDTQRIVLTKCTRGCIATLCNWDKYQGADDSDDSQAAHQVHTECTQAAHQVHLIQEVKKLRSKERGIKSTGVDPSQPRLAEIWNQYRGELPEVRGCTGKRRTHAEARWKEKPDEGYWAEIVSRMSRSSFCLGRKSTGEHSNWKATFDFLLQPDTQHKVLEGKYDDPKHHPNAPNPAHQREIEKLREDARRARYPEEFDL